MKNFSWYKQSPCLLAFLFIGIISVIGLFGAPPLVADTTITSFPPTDFFKVDHTTSEYSKAIYPQDTITGYYHRYDNEYQLTDTIPLMTVAMWNKHKLDLNQNWEFDFQLFFGIGRDSLFSYDSLFWNIDNPIGSRLIADGICFVLHNKNATQTLIGSMTKSIGYGGISPSFAVEFDTEYNFGYEGGNNIGSNHHIAYLKNGSKTALPGTYKPMQNNWANVGWGKWFNVKIVWRKGYANNTTYYDLLTYMEERDTTSVEKHGPLLLRDSIRFYGLSYIVAGLELDSNCQALVNWGITSATCEAANRQMVRFNRLSITEPVAKERVTIGFYNIYGNWLPSSTPPLTLTQTNNNPLYINTQQYARMFSGVIACGAPANLPDTIRNLQFGCLSMYDNSPNNHYLTFWGVDMSDAKWYVNDSLVKTGTTILDTTYSQYIFKITDYKDLYEDSTYLIVKAVVNETDYVFKFAVNENPELAVHLAQALNIQLDTANPSTLNLNINSTSLAQTIQLPEIGGCSDGQRWRQYTWQPPSDSLSPFAVLPQIDSNNVLTFELRPDACSANIYIELLCECNAQFTLAVNNATCMDNPCDVVTFTETRRTYNPSGGMYQMLSFMTPLFIGYSVLVAPPHEITTISAKEIGISYPEVNLVLEDVYNDINSDGEPCKSLYVTLNGRVSDTIYKRYEVCAKLEDGTICCDTFEFYGYFNGKGMIDIMPYGGYVEIAYCDVTSFVETPIGGATGPYIRLTIHDFFGNQVDDLTNEVIATPTGGNIYYDISHLIPGQYTVVFQVNDQIKSKIFLKMAGE